MTRPDPLESALISAWNAGEPVEDEPQTAPATPAPMSGEAAIREQIRRVLAADYASLEPWDYQQQAGVIVDMIRPLVVEAGTLRARVAELEAERHTTNEALTEAAEAIRAKDQQITELEAAAEKAAEFVAQRAEYITAIRGCHDSADYQRWQGHAEARTVLAEKLGLPIAWPTGAGEPS